MFIKAIWSHNQATPQSMKPMHLKKKSGGRGRKICCHHEKSRLLCLPTAREHKATWEALEDMEVRFGGDLYPHFWIFVSIQKALCCVLLKIHHFFWYQGCTRALLKIGIHLWVTKDHLNFFLVSNQRFGCERVLRSYHCEQRLLQALWTLCWLKVTFLSKDVL